MGETSQNCGNQRAYCSSPWLKVSVESCGDDDDDDVGWEKPPNSSTRDLW
jgi:hypothetical protein